jgi:hypothetical protein
LTSSVSAQVFDSDTRYTKDNINYIFKAGLDIKEFDILSSGIIIDDYKYGFTLEGGIIDVSFYDYDDIEVKSSVPQKVRISTTYKGKRLYLNDGVSLYVDSYNFGEDSVRFSLEAQETPINDSYIEFTDSDTISRQKWSERAIFEFEYETSVDENGIISGKTFKFSNLFAIILLVITIMVSMVALIIWRR